ncbi:hypothetical protein IFM89_034175 [Coptis chinensis]|uniref:Uncharacterized protein n=1 Tax=Coptis chinensis TaxID=261450 RepID=A0A835M2Y8_9MAGN|nr:hypothetical protein IFM89_034175 [Coptis chinensis]
MKSDEMLRSNIDKWRSEQSSNKMMVLATNGPKLSAERANRTELSAVVYGYFTQQALRAGYFKHENGLVTKTTDQFPSNQYTDGNFTRQAPQAGYLRNENEGMSKEIIRLEIEKEMIRQQVISAEILRYQEEHAIERDFALHRAEAISRFHLTHGGTAVRPDVRIFYGLELPFERNAQVGTVPTVRNEGQARQFMF